MNNIHLLTSKKFSAVGRPNFTYFNDDDLMCCTHGGDPHTRTFDGEFVHYQGQCKYNLATPKDTSFHVNILIFVNFIHFVGNGIKY